MGEHLDQGRKKPVAYRPDEIVGQGKTGSDRPDGIEETGTEVPQVFGQGLFVKLFVRLFGWHNSSAILDQSVRRHLTLFSFHCKPVIGFVIDFITCMTVH